MKNKSILVLSLIAVFPVTGLASRGGDGVRGGGQAVLDVNHQYKLLDEVTPAKCNYVDADTLIYGNEYGRRGNPVLESFFAKLEAIDWYIAFELKREMRSLFFCFTGPLFAQKANPKITGVLPEPNIRVIQSMFRSGRYVYINSAIERQMNDRTKALYFLHELLHSYLDMDMNEKSRYQQLRSLTVAMGKVIDDQIQTRKDLYFQLKAAESSLPCNTYQLDAFKPLILFMLDLDIHPSAEALNDNKLERNEIYRPTVSQVNFILNHPELDSAISAASVRSIAQFLSPWDARALYPQGPNNNPATADILRSAVLHGLTYGDLNLASRLLDMPRSNRITSFIYVTALNSFVRLAPRIQEKLIQSEEFYQAIETSLHRLINGSIKINYNITLDRNLSDELFVGGNDSYTLIDIVTTSENNGIFPPSMLPLYSVVSSLTCQGRHDLLETLINGNDLFYRAAGLKKAKHAVRTGHLSIERESSCHQKTE